jgi:hypothetical protein
MTTVRPTSPGAARLRLALGAAMLVWLLARLAGWHVLMLGTGMVLACLLPGLALVRLLGLACGSRLWTFFVAATLSPPLLALAAGLASFPGRSVALAGQLVIALCAALLLLPARRTDAQTIAGERAPAPEDLPGLALGVVLAVVVAIGLLHPFVRMWSDSWFHAAMFQEVLRAGVPPEYPHFAGNAVPYPWFFHVFLVAASGLAGDDPFLLMAALNTWSALLFPIGGYLLARALGLAPRASLGSALVVVLGTNPFGVVWYLGRGLIGETRGPAALAVGFSNCNQGMGALAFHFPLFQSSLLARFWTPTAYDFGLVLLLLVLLALLAAWKRPSLRGAAGFGGVLLLLLLWHTLTALQLSIGIAAGVASATLRGNGGAARRRAALIAAAGASAFVLALPYLHFVTVGNDPGQMLRLRLVVPNAMGLAFSMSAVAFAGVLGLRRLPADRVGLASGLALGLLLPFLFAQLPGRAGEKFYFPPFLVLASVAGAAVTAAWSRGGWLRLGLAGMIALALGNAAVISAAFLRDPRSLRSMFAEVRPGDPAFLTADEAAALRWVRERSPREAAFLQSPRPFGTEPILALGGRRLYLGMAESFYDEIQFRSPGRPSAPPAVWAELRRREALQRAVFSGRALAPDSLALLRAFPKPLFIWRDTGLGDGVLSPTLLAPEGITRTVFQTRQVSILELVRGTPAGR